MLDFFIESEIDPIVYKLMNDLQLLDLRSSPLFYSPNKLCYIYNGISHLHYTFDDFKRINEDTVVSIEHTNITYGYINNLNLHKKQKHIGKHVINVYNDEIQKKILVTMVVSNEASIDKIIANENYIIAVARYVYSAMNCVCKLYTVLDTLVEMFENKDIYMYSHMNNVASMCLKVAEILEFTNKEKFRIIVAGLTHDIGKLFISDRILNCSEQLSNIEKNIIQRHSNKGGDLFDTIFYEFPFLNGISDIIRCHHENYDGSGYPGKIKHDEIPLLSRIIRIVDSIDAMKAERPYKDAFSKDMIYKEIRKYCGLYYDPCITSIVLKNFDYIICNSNQLILNNDFWLFYYDISTNTNSKNLIRNGY